jgi:hypothetical protein
LIGLTTILHLWILLPAWKTMKRCSGFWNIFLTNDTSCQVDLSWLKISLSLSLFCCNVDPFPDLFQWVIDIPQYEAAFRLTVIVL